MHVRQRARIAGWDWHSVDRNGRPFQHSSVGSAEQARLFDIGAQSHRLLFESADESPIVLDQALLLVQLPHDIILAGNTLNTQPAPLASLPIRLKSRPQLPRSRLGPTPSPPTTEATLPHSHIEGIQEPDRRRLRGVVCRHSEREVRPPRAAHRSGKRTLTTDSVAVDDCERVWITMRGGSSCRFSM